MSPKYMWDRAEEVSAPRWRVMVCGSNQDGKELTLFPSGQHAEAFVCRSFSSADAATADVYETVDARTAIWWLGGRGTTTLQRL